MTLKRQFSLFPERGDQLRSALHALQTIAREGVDLADHVQAQIA